jgi:hypothetical protein
MCRKWVDEKAKNSAMEARLINTASYELQVQTGAMKGAATDARVYVELYGANALLPSAAHLLAPAAAAAAAVGAPGSAGMMLRAAATAGAGPPAAATPGGVADSSGEFRLFDADSPVKPFQRGATDAFTVSCYNVGLPQRLKVWHDNTGRHPDFFLVDIRVRKQGAREWTTFPCSRCASLVCAGLRRTVLTCASPSAAGQPSCFRRTCCLALTVTPLPRRWLSTQQDDGAISRVLLAGSARAPVSYRVTVCTSDQRGAGTDANARIQLHGLLGDGLEQPLLGGPRAFDRCVAACAPVWCCWWGCRMACMHACMPCICGGHSRLPCPSQHRCPRATQTHTRLQGRG